MAAAISGNQTYQTDTTDTVYTLSSYTPAAGSNRILVVRVNALRTSETGAFTVDSVTFGGVSLTQAIQANTTSTARTYRSAIFYLINPSSSAGDVVVTLSHAASSCIISADTLTGALQSSPVGLTGSSTATPAASIADTSSESGSIGILAVTTRCQGGTPSWTFSDSGAAASYVEQYDIAVVPSDSTEVAGAGASVLGPSVVTDHLATQSASNVQVAVYAEFKAASTSITGTASITQAGNTVSSASTIKLAGTSSVTQAANTLSATGVLPLVGTASITQGGDTVASVGTVALTGAANITQEDNTLDGVGVIGNVPISGEAALTQDDNTLSSTGVLAIVGQSAVTQVGDSLAAAGTIGIAGVFSVTQDDNATASAAVLLLSGAAAVTQDGNTLSATGAVGEVPLSGELAVTQDDNTLSSAGTLAIYGQLVIEQAGDALVSVGFVAVGGAADIAQAGDTLSATGALSNYGTVAITQADNTLSAVGVSNLLSWTYEGTVEFPNHTGIVYYPAPVGEVMASGDIDNIEL